MTTAVRLTVIRYQCPHCHRTRSKRTAAEAHIDRCWHNPAARACKTCEHHRPAYSGQPCIPGQNCSCNEEPESCAIEATPDPTLPIVGCPKWTGTVPATEG